MGPEKEKGEVGRDQKEELSEFVIKVELNHKGKLLGGISFVVSPEYQKAYLDGFAGGKTRKYIRDTMTGIGEGFNSRIRKAVCRVCPNCVHVRVDFKSPVPRKMFCKNKKTKYFKTGEELDENNTCEHYVVDSLEKRNKYYKDEK